MTVDAVLWKRNPAGIFVPPQQFVFVAKTPPATVNNSTYNSTGTSTTRNVTLPASIVSGNILLLVVACSNSVGAPSITTPSGWTLLGSVASQGLISVGVYYKLATGSEGSTVAVTASANGAWAAVGYQISGAKTAGITAGTWVTGSSTTSPDPPNVAPGSGSYLVIAIASGEQSSTQTVSAYPSGYSNGQLAATSSTLFRSFVAAAEKALTGVSSEDPGAFTLGTSTSNYAAQTVAVPAV